MKFLTEKEIESIDDEYYKDRYNYLKEVIDQIKLMDNITTILELGPYKSPLVENEDVVDMTDEYLKCYPIKIGKYYKHDCSITPYPFKDKQYDLVIACQILEHLGTNQIEVFKELCRIGKKAIITLPYKWNLPCDPHHMIDENVIDHWAQGLKPVFEKIMGSRILRVYNFDDSLTSLELNKKLQEHADFQISNRFKQELNKRREIEGELAEKNWELTKIEKELTDKNRELTKIEKELTDKNRELTVILDSNSWKLTKTFRELRARIRERK